MNIYLIGMPLSGKTTVGEKLSKQLNYKFIDLDEYIEVNACMFIDEIFEAYGEKYFRILESNMLKEVLNESDNKVISCGGGIILNKENKKLMNGIIIYLKCSCNTLISRITIDDKRPLLKNNRIEDLYNTRKDKYLEFSDYTVINDSIDECINEILNIVEKYEKNINY